MKPIHQPRRIKNFFTCLAYHFVNDRCLESAGALAYISLLSLVPLMTVGFTLFAAFPAFDESIGKVQNFVFGNLMPASGEIVRTHLRDFMDKASALTLPGLVALLVTALLSMATIDRTLNAIWKVRRHRSLVNAFTVYWAVLTIGPILIGISLAATSYVVSLPFFANTAHGPSDPGAFLELLPFFAAMLAFTLLYAIVPYRRVPIHHAMAGGVMAAVLFESAKEGFALFVTYFSTYEAIYGALAALPLFLIWIYLSWPIILFGAEFTYCLGNSSSILERDAGQSDRVSDRAAPGGKGSHSSGKIMPGKASMAEDDPGLGIASTSRGFVATKSRKGEYLGTLGRG
uniref:UPF0761 membrane protein BECKLFY1418B_GA0070995_102013 n=1 Tax=Candidatus Kentrum sp. LFY TaxID=2126342 RepID=A0A450UDP7_9GAMM|nr:MAG: membrane protein [Candidatus Kentron sp. LFY]